MADSFQAKGIEAGAFLFLPSLETEASWTDNVFATASDARSDRFYRIVPGFRLRSRFLRHELNFTGELEKVMFEEYTEDDRLNVNVGADGRLDVRKGWEVTSNISFSDRAEDRGSPDAALSLKPVDTTQISAQLGSRLQEGRMIYQGTFSFNSYDIGNGRRSGGQVVNNSGRDRNEYEVTARVAYETIPNYFAVVEGSYNSRDYDNVVPGTSFDRSSDGYRLESGVGIDITDVIRGDFLVGYFDQEYDATTFGDPSGFSFRARFNWTPTRMTVVVPSLERSVQETIRSGVSAMVRTGAGLTVRHEFARNFVGTFSGNVAYEDYDKSNEDPWFYEARLRGLYAFTPEVHAGAEIRYRERDADGGSGQYDQWTMMWRLRLQY
ncbi:outer membrane beta-barrel protein [Niveispirillum lacus]|uniref:outer membrane beta-barrel protein n=1 Tax=Niveispirillum lacus TaxID=1981099 RepID=UPI0013FE3A82|nr:outer membrane beta-barrel protein [Niveispirillum lacus]